MQDSEPAVRRETVLALSKVQSKDIAIYSALLNSLEDANDEVRSATADVLIHLQPTHREVLKILLGRLNEPSFYLRWPYVKVMHHLVLQRNHPMNQICYSNFLKKYLKSVWPPCPDISFPLNQFISEIQFNKMISSLDKL